MVKCLDSHDSKLGSKANYLQLNGNRYDINSNQLNSYVSINDDDTAAIVNGASSASASAARSSNDDANNEDDDEWREVGKKNRAFVTRRVS